MTHANAAIRANTVPHQVVPLSTAWLLPAIEHAEDGLATLGSADHSVVVVSQVTKSHRPGAVRGIVWS
jgi:hypothetical protein